MRRFIHWFKAMYLGGCYWRVIYKDDPRRTYLMNRKSASDYASMFDGEAFIDYEIIGL